MGFVFKKLFNGPVTATHRRLGFRALVPAPIEPPVYIIPSIDSFDLNSLNLPRGTYDITITVHSVGIEGDSPKSNRVKYSSK